eukprot:gene12832-7182_t
MFKTLNKVVFKKLDDEIVDSSQTEKEENEKKVLIEFLSQESSESAKDDDSLLSNMYPSLRVEYDEYCTTIKDVIEPMSFEDFIQQSQEKMFSHYTSHGQHLQKFEKNCIGCIISSKDEPSTKKEQMKNLFKNMVTVENEEYIHDIVMTINDIVLYEEDEFLKKFNFTIDEFIIMLKESGGIDTLCQVFIYQTSSKDYKIRASKYF